MSAYDDMLIRQGQPDEAEEGDEPEGDELDTYIQAARNLRWLLSHPGQCLPRKEVA